MTDEQKPKAWNGEPPTYTQVPNALFDVAMCDMGAAELKVVLAVIRKTIGWHKQRDAISLSQLEEMTGLARANVIRGVREAAKNGWIRHYKAGRTSYYELALREKIDADSIAAIPPSDGITAIPPMVLQQYQNGIAAVPEMVSQQYPQKKGKKERKKGKENSLARATRGAGADASSSVSERMEAQPQTAEAAPILEQPRVDSTLADEPVVPKTKTKAASKETPAHPHTPYGDCFVGVAKACAMDPKVPMLAKRISVAAKYLAQRSVDAACLERFRAWWTASDWRGQRGEKPTPERIVELWLQFEGAPAARPVVRPAAPTNGRTFRRSQSAFTDADRARAEAEALAALDAEGAR